ncbi:MAG TPA: hypothetical protein VK254_02670 [Candidatus Bathyarchaeia archaeon]|nr:hypothetical protein [Candidatus Bathyarchaeia archaeon]
MVTNINLSSSEISEKKSFSGKSALIFSALIMALIVVVILALFFLKSRYASQDSQISAQITQEQNKSNGPDFADLLDFQSRLNLADKMIDDHAYWDSMLKKISVYILPDVKLTKFSAEKNSGGLGKIELTGTAVNLDALSRQLILLKDFPNLESLAFKDAGNSQQGTSQLGGITFEAGLKINKEAFRR